MRWALGAIFVMVVAACQPHADLPRGPQPFLIVRVVDSQTKLVMAGTIASDVTMEYSGESADHKDAFEFYGALTEKTPSGFRFQWRVVRRTGGREVQRIDKEQFAPWGVETPLESIPGYVVRAFYAPEPASEYLAPKT
jgi:hypothetical protein